MQREEERHPLRDLFERVAQELSVQLLQQHEQLDFDLCLLGLVTLLHLLQEAQHRGVFPLHSGKTGSKNLYNRVSVG